MAYNPYAGQQSYGGAPQHVPAGYNPYNAYQGQQQAAPPPPSNSDPYFLQNVFARYVSPFSLYSSLIRSIISPTVFFLTSRVHATCGACVCEKISFSIKRQNSRLSSPNYWDSRRAGASYRVSFRRGIRRRVRDGASFDILVSLFFLLMILG